METSTLVLLSSSITAASTLLGVGITQYFNQRTALRLSHFAKESADRTREADERKHYRDLLFRVGVDWWKYDQPSGVKTSLEVYLTRMDAFFTLYIEENPNLEKAVKKQVAYSEFLDDQEKRLKPPAASPGVS